MNGDLLDATFGVVDKFEELGAMLHGKHSLAQFRRGSSVPVAITRLVAWEIVQKTQRNCNWP